MADTEPVVDESTLTEMTYKRNVIEGNRAYEFTATAMSDGRTAVCIRSGSADTSDLHELSGVIAKEDLAAVASILKAELSGIATWHGIDINKRSRNNASVRARYPNAYLLWKREEDERLLQLRREGRSAREIAKELGRQIGAIHRRLEKHGLST